MRPIPLRWPILFTLAVLLLNGCDGSTDGGADTTTASTSTTVAPTTTVAAATSQDEATNLAIGESFVDAFYAFDPVALKALFVDGDAAALAVWYQGWAEAAHYKVIERAPCRVSGANDPRVFCPVTVEDDLLLSLGSDFKVTDTFRLIIEDGLIANVSNTSNDPQYVASGLNWVFEKHPELEEGPCKDMFDVGETPGDCARAVVDGLREYVESDDFGGLN